MSEQARCECGHMQGEESATEHSQDCRVSRYECNRCGKYRSWCVTDRELTQHNRCDCEAGSAAERCSECVHTLSLHDRCAVFHCGCAGFMPSPEPPQHARSSSAGTPAQTPEPAAKHTASCEKYPLGWSCSAECPVADAALVPIVSTGGTPEPQTAPEITDDAVSTLNAATEQITRLWERSATLEKALRRIFAAVDHNGLNAILDEIRLARAALSGERPAPPKESGNV